jgi:hypothetical protein
MLTSAIPVATILGMSLAPVTTIIVATGQIVPTGQIHDRFLYYSGISNLICSYPTLVYEGTPLRANEEYTVHQSRVYEVLNRK